MSQDLKESLKNQRDDIMPPPSRTIDFQTDTIKPGGQNSGGAYFSSDKNTITQNYVEGKNNSHSQSRSTLAHEQKHRDNNNAIDRRTVPMSLEQYYKICCYDEISANTCELLQLRQEYLAAKTESDKQKIMKDTPKFSYYFNAVQNGTINPESQSPAEFDKEMRFIAVETQKMWMDKYAEWYDKEDYINMNHPAFIKEYFKTKDYQDLAPNDANYNKVCQTYMTCGGIDFSQYLEDIPCINENIKEADKAIAQKLPRSEVKKHITPQYRDQTHILPPQNIQTEGLSPIQQYQVARQQMFVENFLANNENFTQMEEMNDNLRLNIADKIKNYANEIATNPTMKKNWQEAEKQLAEQIAELNQNTFITDKASKEAFDKAISKINTTPAGINLQEAINQGHEMYGCELIDIADVCPKNEIPEIIHQIGSPEWLMKYSQTPVRDESKATIDYTSYQGAPQYPEWSPDKRVSPVQHAEIYDFSSDFLLQQQNQLAQNAKENIKESMKRDSRVADELYSRRSTPSQQQILRPNRKEQIITPSDNANISTPIAPNRFSKER